jgi:dimethylhistidine N-methyltransferase
MSIATSGPLGPLEGFHDYGGREADFQAAVLEGLARPQKQVPAKFFYDERGSQLFDQICELEEYYPTRTEMALLRRHAGEVAELTGPGASLIEFGAGSNIKAQILLDALDHPVAFVPIDISREHLLASSRELARLYPDVAVIPVCADYTKTFDLPAAAAARHRLGFYPGSTIGNFRPVEAAGFLGRIASILGAGNGLLIGVDLKKDVAILQAAYDDAKGVTAAFNLNLLARMNRELGTSIDLDTFEHRAVYNAERGCIEMHLVSRVAQTIEVAGQAFRFEAGETIHTEDSHKYTIGEFADLAAASGWTSRQVWTDENQLFSLHYLTAD